MAAARSLLLACKLACAPLLAIARRPHKSSSQLAVADSEMLLLVLPPFEALVCGLPLRVPLKPADRVGNTAVRLAARVARAEATCATEAFRFSLPITSRCCNSFSTGSWNRVHQASGTVAAVTAPCCHKPFSLKASGAVAGAGASTRVMAQADSRRSSAVQVRVFLDMAQLKQETKRFEVGLPCGDGVRRPTCPSARTRPASCRASGFG